MKSIYLLVAVALLAGCGESNRTVSSPPPPPPVTRYYVPHMDVYEFHLRDGTRCVVKDGYKSGGITCEWRPAAQAVRGLE